ncbi:MAG TPA: VTT domain-containing protein [Xanthobacteraceae bacterium]|jgi:uncharacterized membrane protein YdjX (TVP38/TMEM64 family)
MIPESSRPSAAAGPLHPRLPLRLLPLAVLVVVAAAIVVTGSHRQFSFAMLVRHYAALRAFIADHEPAALGGYVGLYVAAVGLSVPVGIYLTLIGGILFGAVLGGVAALIGATLGAICIFLIARSALGEQLVRRAGVAAGKLGQEFRADAFHYLLFLRLVPIFPFWLVNLVAALSGVRLATFAAATALGIIPASFAFAFAGAGLDSVIAAQETAFRLCLESDRADCRLEFHLAEALTPQLLLGLAALGIVALLPVVGKRIRRRRTDAGCPCQMSEDRCLMTDVTEQTKK